METKKEQGNFPTSAGILFGLGLGGFFDGIVLHQVLQWHHMVVAGLVILWRHAHLKHVRWSTKLLTGTVLMGFGIFNLVEGIIDHHLLGLHHVNETVPRDQWVYWDVGFLIWGAVMLIAGVYLKRAGRIETPSAVTTQAA